MKNQIDRVLEVANYLRIDRSWRLHSKVISVRQRAAAMTFQTMLKQQRSQSGSTNEQSVAASAASKDLIDLALRASQTRLVRELTEFGPVASRLPVHQYPYIALTLMCTYAHAPSESAWRSAALQVVKSVSTHYKSLTASASSSSDLTPEMFLHRLILTWLTVDNDLERQSLLLPDVPPSSRARTLAAAHVCLQWLQRFNPTWLHASKSSASPVLSTLLTPDEMHWFRSTKFDTAPAMPTILEVVKHLENVIASFESTRKSWAQCDKDEWQELRIQLLQFVRKYQQIVPPSRRLSSSKSSASSSSSTSSALLTSSSSLSRHPVVWQYLLDSQLLPINEARLPLSSRGAEPSHGVVAIPTDATSVQKHQAQVKL